MKIIKLILLACPVIIASMLVLANPAAASSLKSKPVTPQITLIAAQSIHQAVITPHFSADSQSLTDYLGCNCATCTQAKLQMEGKLTLMNLL